MFKLESKTKIGLEKGFSNGESRRFAAFAK